MKRSETPVETARDIRERLVESGTPGDAFERLPPSHRKKWIDYIERAKRPDTRARRIERMLTALRK